jgi:hypothetical protein
MNKKRRNTSQAGETLAHRTTGRMLITARSHGVVELPRFEVDVARTQTQMREALGDVPSDEAAVELGRRSSEALGRARDMRGKASAKGVVLPSLRTRRGTVLAGTYDRAMTPPNKRTVRPHSEGWAVHKPRAARVSSVHPTQKQAIDAVRQNLKNTGGGELAVKGRNGTVRAQDTVAPGNDPRSSKG